MRACTALAGPPGKRALASAQRRHALRACKERSGVQARLRRARGPTELALALVPGTLEKLALLVLPHLLAALLDDAAHRCSLVRGLDRRTRGFGSDQIPAVRGRPPQRGMGQSFDCPKSTARDELGIRAVALVPRFTVRNEGKLPSSCTFRFPIGGGEQHGRQHVACGLGAVSLLSSRFGCVRSVGARAHEQGGDPRMAARRKKATRKKATRKKATRKKATRKKARKKASQEGHAQEGDSQEGHSQEGHVARRPTRKKATSQEEGHSQEGHSQEGHDARRPVARRPLARRRAQEGTPQEGDSQEGDFEEGPGPRPAFAAGVSFAKGYV